MTDEERYEEARGKVVVAVREFVEAGNILGRSDAEIQADFIVAFSQAMQEEAQPAA